MTANEAFARIDAVLNAGAVDVFLATPPVSPNDGDVYIVANAATGDWTGHDEEIAYFDQTWRFVVPNVGMSLWVDSQAQTYVYDGSDWINVNSFGVRTGANERMGAATLSGGTVTVSNTNVTASSHIFLTPEGSSTGSVRVSARNAGVEFTITSSDAASSDVVSWLLVEPA